jgi:hypothetical protein
VIDDDIDRVLSSDDSIVPSSGFAASVMEAVRRDAETPPPIPFPWKRALPGLIFCFGALAALFIMGLSQPGRGTEMSVTLTQIVNLANNAGVGWIALALVVSLVSVVVSMRAAARGAGWHPNVT